MLKTLDDEFARYLASYLQQNSDDFASMSRYERVDIDVDKLYELIKQFRQELP